MMNRFFAIILSCVLCFTLFGCNQAVPVKNDQTTASDNTQLPVPPTENQTLSYQGDWQAAKAILAGAPFPDSVTEGITLSINGSEYTVMVAGKADKGTCEVDQSSSPLRMTIRGTEGPNNGKTFLAICDFPNGEEMRICYDMKGVSFPVEFVSTAESGYFLVSYQRKN